MTLTSLVDFSALGTAIEPLMTAGITAAVLIGGSVLAAKLVWGFFKKFARG